MNFIAKLFIEILCIQLFTKGTFGKGLRSLQENTREYSSQGWRRKNTYVQQLLFGNTSVGKS